VRSVALDTSSRSSVGLARVLCHRTFRIDPVFSAHPPDLDAMLASCDAAVLIGDVALFLDGAARAIGGREIHVEKIDLGEVWTTTTGLPFVYAFWAGPGGALGATDVIALQRARDDGVASVDRVAHEYFSDAPDRAAIGARYLRDNIKYRLGPDERAGLELFFEYAAEAGVVDAVQPLRFFDA
jgi:chorismate dehydratase